VGRNEKFVKLPSRHDIASGRTISMNMNQEKLQELAKDLRQQEPRPAYEKLGGFEMAARTLDKCRATLLGIEGEFRFGCPMDQEFFHDAGIRQNEFEAVVASGASDKEVGAWIQEHSLSARRR
jgi:Domain of unknown function (DUF5069)